MKRLLPLLAFVVTAFGCGGPGPDPKVEDNRLEAAQKVRVAFDKVGGNYNALSAEEKGELLKLFDGNEQNLQQTWNLMLNKGQTQTGGPR